MSREPLRRLLMLLPLAVGVPGAEDGAVAALSLETEPTEFTWQARRQGLSLSGRDEFGVHAALVASRLATGPLAEGLGGIYGGELAVGHGAFAGSGSELSWGEGRLVLGLERPLDPAWRLAVLGRLGAGVCRLDLATPSRRFQADGVQAMAAGEFAVWREGPAGSWRLALGWRWSQALLAEGEVDIALRQSGPTIAIGWGYRL